MRLIQPNPQIYLFLSKSATELGQMFVRLSEFYENSNPQFRGQLFSLAQFKKYYADNISDKNKFDYYTTFFGYNIPGYVVVKFFKLYHGRMSEDEIALQLMLGKTPEKFYVIGASEDSLETIDHELSHALFYIYEDYKYKMLELESGNNFFWIRKFLESKGYDESVLPDEITSYVMFDTKMLNRNKVKTKHLNKLREQMLEVYRDYKKRFITVI